MRVNPIFFDIFIVNFQKLHQFWKSVIFENPVAALNVV